jgi:type II secretory pathway pseudopilin PulG
MEILVVVAELGILTAILLPVFARVREKGRQATCQSNLKQIYSVLDFSALLHGLSSRGV